jgi:hypothetical protein
MADRQVKCVKRLRLDFPNPNAVITHLGGDGWMESRPQVVRDIDSGVHTYYTVIQGKRVGVEVRGGMAHLPPFVQARVDGEWSNDLLELPDCPTSEVP